MNFAIVRWRLGFVVILAAVGMLLNAAWANAQGGEPRSFAIRGAKVVPVSGPAMDDATVVVSLGVIAAVGKDVAIPADAWVIEGKGLTVYPGFIDGFTDVGLIAAPASGGGGESGRPPAPGNAAVISRGPEDRPATTPWRNAMDEINPSDSRIESWRSAGFTTTISAPKGAMFPGQAAVLDLEGERAGNL